MEVVVCRVYGDGLETMFKSKGSLNLDSCPTGSLKVGPIGFGK